MANTQRYSLTSLNHIFRKYKTDYKLQENKKEREVYLVNTKTNKKTLIESDYKTRTINDESLLKISELINSQKKEPGNIPLDWENQKEIYADLSKKDRYGLEGVVTTTIIISSLLIIALSSITITGNAVADSPEFTESAIFALFVVLVMSFVLFLKNKKKK